MKIYSLLYAYAYESDEFKGAFESFDLAVDAIEGLNLFRSEKGNIATENGAEFGQGYHGYYIIESELNQKID